jgi:hypothetical protein
MVPKLQMESAVQEANSVAKLVRIAREKDAIIIKSRVQAHDHGSKYYNLRDGLSGETKDSFRQHYHDCWYSMFTPVPNLARRIEDDLETLSLVPGEFAFVHVRSAYGVEDTGRDPELVKNWTLNALNCVSGLRPGGPYFFSSDSLYAKQVAIEYGLIRNVSIVATLDGKEPLHLDLAPDWERRSPSEYFSIFEDLYLMSMGICMSYNVGGFAKWAQLISGKNFTCNNRHWTKGVDQKSAGKKDIAYSRIDSLEIITITLFDLRCRQKWVRLDGTNSGPSSLHQSDEATKSFFVLTASRW